MKTEEKTNVPRVRIAVLGNVNVGKSALTVRYLTRRFIGEYSSNTDLLYKQTVTLDSGVLDVEIVDISAENDNGFPVEQIQWADACLIVYSITERTSYEYAKRSLAELRQLQNAPSAYLVGNKLDLDHLREVQETEGASLAASHAIGFCEVSVADNSPALYKAFERLLAESRARPVKPRKFSVSKMFGTLIGNNGPRQPSVNQGTVVPCHKGELHKSRVMKRRQAFTATASL
ncbi:ras-related and estrogen-regulated growth inhibitor-like protein [Anopheles cruzii]|uniref:ras-related and estrogen-regulated growth inhibitor-like protein n=1 Tax=Anopheles cruzii TaxID=68878 RepID=UPI0022EC8653|nr:ras-related and estrogen-regulated growth inhibitor-like protein [Anopheles cruzii]